MTWRPRAAAVLAVVGLVLGLSSSAHAYLLAPDDARFARALEAMAAGDPAEAALQLAALREDLEREHRQQLATSPLMPSAVVARMALLTTVRDEMLASARAGQPVERIRFLASRLIELDPATPLRRKDRVRGIAEEVATLRAAAGQRSWRHAPRLVVTQGEPGVVHVVTPADSNIREMYLYVTDDLTRLSTRVVMEDRTDDSALEDGRLWSGEFGRGYTIHPGTIFYTFEARLPGDRLEGGVTWYPCEVVPDLWPASVRRALVALDGRVHAPSAVAALARLRLIEVHELGSTVLPKEFEGVDTGL